MDRQDGIRTLGVMKAQPNPPRVIMPTTFEHDDIAYRAVEAGADGFLLKPSSPDQIGEGIREVAAGRGAVSALTAGQLINRVVKTRPARIEVVHGDRCRG